MVERESILPLNMQYQKKSQTIVEDPLLVQQLQEVVEQPKQGKLKGVLVETSTHVGGNFEPSGKWDHMQPYLQVGGGAMCSDRPKEEG